MTTGELSLSLTAMLKSYIKMEGYYSSGKLYDSIKITVKDNPSSGLSIDLDSLPYINYLEDGKLLTNFFAQEKVKSVIFDYGMEQILASIENIDL